jgi:hypothetical protein
VSGPPSSELASADEHPSLPVREVHTLKLFSCSDALVLAVRIAATSGERIEAVSAAFLRLLRHAAARIAGMASPCPMGELLVASSRMRPCLGPRVAFASALLLLGARVRPEKTRGAQRLVAVVGLRCQLAIGLARNGFVS